MAIFVKKAPACRMFMAPGACHELLNETDSVREATLKVVCDFFTQKSDDVSLVQPCYPLAPHDPTAPIYSWTEIVLRGTGILLATVGVIAGVAMIVGGERRRK